MGYDEYDALIRIEILFQYGQSGDIQIIRRFVQKEYIGLIHEQAQQIEPAPFTAAELIDIGILHIFREQELFQQARCRNVVAKLVDYVMAVFLDVIDDPLGFVEFRELLRKKSEADGLTDGYGSRNGRQLAGNDPEQR